LAFANADVNSDKVANVLVDVLLHRVAAIDVGADFAKDLLPRMPNLSAQISTQRTQILVEASIAVARTRPESRGTIEVISQPGSGGVTVLPTAWALDDKLVHVFTHHKIPTEKVFDKKLSADGLIFSRAARISPSGFGSMRCPKPSTHELAQCGVLMCLPR